MMVKRKLEDSKDEHIDLNLLKSSSGVGTMLIKNKPFLKPHINDKNNMLTDRPKKSLIEKTLENKSVIDNDNNSIELIDNI